LFLLVWTITCLKKAFMQALKAIVLAGYNDKTICNFFRKRGAQIGEGCYICTKSIGVPWLVRIGNNVWISKDVIFHGHDGGTWVLRDKYPDLDVYGYVIIEDNCMIGRGVQLLPNIRIGRNSIVGAGSVVISDIPPNSIVLGIPARPISSFVKYEENCLAKWREQTPPGLNMSKKEWWRVKENKEKIRRHLTELYMNRAKEEKGNADN
jgi:acetyltransferase-like isoleucine patch superfamily enzyme